jgi:hypothetical protein
MRLRHCREAYEPLIVCTDDWADVAILEEEFREMARSLKKFAKHHFGIIRKKAERDR